MKKEKSTKMRRELEDGLEKWGKQILEVQDNNINMKKEKSAKMRRELEDGLEK